MVKIRPSATETVEKPLPSPVPFQTREGPSAGHSLSRLVSVEMSSRLGPRHWGQSPGAAEAIKEAKSQRARQVEPVNDLRINRAHSRPGGDQLQDGGIREDPNPLERKQRGRLHSKTCGIMAALDSATASWSARSPLPLFPPRDH